MAGHPHRWSHEEDDGGPGDDRWPAFEYWERPPFAARLLDVLAMVFLLLALTWGAGMLACTRVWGFSIGLLLLVVGVLFVALRPLVVRHSPSWRLPWAAWPFCALVAYVVVRDLYAPAYVAARWDLIKWVAYLGVGVAWTQLAKTPQRWKIIVAALLILGTIEAFVGIFQHMTDSKMILWMEQDKSYYGRVSGTFLCPNHFANLVAMLVPVAVAVMLAPGAGLPLRMLSVYFLLAALPSIYWSLSRSAMVSVLLGLAAAAMLWLWRTNRRYFCVSLVVMPLLVAGIALGALFVFPTLKARFDGSFAENNGSWAARRNMWQDSPAMIQDSPVVGHGGGQWVWAYPRFQNKARLELTYDYPHNEYVQVVAEYGMIGAGLLLVALLGAAVAWMMAMRRVRDSAVACFLAGVGGALICCLAHAVFDFNFHIFPNPLLLVTLCGLAWGAVLGETTPPPAEERATIQRRLVRGGLGLATAVVAVCVGVVTFRAGWSYWRYIDGEVAREYVRTDTACEKFAASVAWDPKNEKPHLGLAYVRRTEATWVRAGTPEEQKKAKRELAAQSEEEARIALALNPLEPEALYLIGCARNMQDDPEGALQAFRDAFAIRPMERFYAKEVASQLTQMGRIGEAVAFLRARREEKLEDGASRKLLQKLERPAAH